MKFSVEYFEKRLVKNEKIDEREINRILVALYHDMQNNKLSSVHTSIICRIAERKIDSDMTQELISECIEASRVFVYKDMIKGAKKAKDSVYYSFAKDFYTRKSGITLTRQQKEIISEFENHKRIVVSAPTSFGKSTIVTEIINIVSDKNIAIIVPTISLLVEYVTRFIKDKRFEGYELIYTSSQELKTRNIFIVTPERMDIILDANLLLKLDLFVMDEIYKISNKDDRSLIFTNCLYRLANMSKKFYLIGPYFNRFSANFLKKYDAKFLQYDTEIVAKNRIDISDIPLGNIVHINNKNIRKIRNEYKNIVRCICALDGQSLVYSGNTYRAELISKHLCEFFSDIDSNESLAKFISNSIGKEWSLVKYIKRGIAFHHARMPKYIQRELVRNFNDGKIKILVCTSTLIEGVNTSAKNVIIVDNDKGGNDLTGFDVKNIEGRSGRLGVHFIGESLTLSKLPKEENVDLVPFSFLDSYRLTDEENVLIKSEDLNKSTEKQRARILSDCKENGIEPDVILKNKYIEIKNQFTLVDLLRKDKELRLKLYFPESMPEKETLREILLLAHNYLIPETKRAQKNPYPDQLVTKALFYIYIRPTTYDLIMSWPQGSFDTKLRNTFKIISQYFEFHFPKALSSFENIYNAIHNRKISLAQTIARLEHGFEKKHEILLKEVGLPPSIIKKISNDLDETYSIREIQRKVRQRKFSKLTSYEEEILRQTLLGI